jgi:hypothetical protein
MKNLWAILLLVSSNVFSCDETSDSIILIKEISPGIAQILEIGHDYNISIKAKYKSTVPSGSISLIIQRAESEYPPLCTKTQEITDNEGIVELSCVITLPNTSMLTAFVPFFGAEECRTRTVDSRAFETVDNRKSGKI